MFKRVPQVPFRFERLEPRILLSADPVTTGVALLAADSANDADDINDSLSSSFPKTFPTLTEKSDTSDALSLDDVGAFFGGESEPPRIVVFIDSRVDDYRTLLDGIDEDVDVVMLDQNEDGIGQISKYLADTTNVGAMHVVSHGDEQGVWLGETWLDNDTLGDRSDDVAAWANSLAVDADILFYGCNLAAGADGQLLIQRLADLSGADIAASTNLTGSTQLGGDWEFEYQLGTLEDGAIFNAAAQAEWRDVLALQAYESFDYAAGSLETNNGGTGWSSAWNTSGGSSAVVNASGLSDPAGLLPTQAGTAEMNTTFQYTQTRDLDTAIGADGTTKWASFLLKVDTLSGGISLRIGDGAGADDFVTVGTVNNDFILTENGSTTGASYINNVLTDGQTYFMAAKLDFAAGNDTVTLYVDPTPGLASPDSSAAWTAQLTIADMGSFTEMGLTGGFSGNNSNIDEIRIGDTFADVAPGSYYLDEFNTTASYAGDDGTLTWTADWQEVNDGGAAGAGDVRVVDEFTGGGVEVVLKNDRGLYREADLSGFGTASLTFDYARVDLEAGDDLVVFAQSSAVGGGVAIGDAPGLWYEVGRYSGAADDGAYLSDAIDISAFIASDTKLMFFAENATLGNDKIYVDNVRIDLDAPILAGDFVVTNTNNGGAGSLEWAITQANASSDYSVITFNIAGGGPHVITVDADGLPYIDERVFIDGWSEPGYAFDGVPVIQVDGSSAVSVDGLRLDPGSDRSTIRGLAITNFSSRDGIDVRSDYNTIVGNYLGVGADGTTVGSNNVDLILQAGASENQIGDSGINEGNVAAGGGFAGIQITGSGTDDNVVMGNDIGLDAVGSLVPSGTFGIGMWNGPDGNQIGGINSGEGNRIAGFAGGIIVDSNSTDTTNTAILGNLIWGNSSYGIGLENEGITYNDADDADSGSNDLLNFPELTKVENDGADLDVEFTLDVPAGTYRIEFFDNPNGVHGTGFGEGEVYLGALTVVSAGNGPQYFTGTISNKNISDSAAVTATATVNLGGGTYGATSEFSQSFGGFSGQLWFSTDGDVSSHSGDTGSVSGWGNEDIVQIGGPNFSLDPVTTDGTFTIPFDLSGPINIDAIDYVTSASITIGSGTTFTLNAGDILFSIDENGQTFTSSNTLNNVDDADVVVFRPDTSGDYSAGNFYMLLENPTGNDIEGISLIEAATDVGDHTLSAGSFVYADGGGSGANDVKIYTPGNVGAGSTSGGTVQTLIDGDELNVSSDKIIEDAIAGIEVVESGMTLGGETLQQGDILLSMVGGGKKIGDNSQVIDNEDIGLLRVDKTTLINGTTESTGSMLLEGNDVGLGSGSSEFDGIAIKTSESDPNDAPTISGGPYDLGSTDEDTPSTGVQVSTILAGLTTFDADGDTLGIAVTAVTGNNVWQYSTDSTNGVDGTWTDFSAVNPNSALLLSDSTWVRYNPDTMNGESVSIDFRAWDGTTGTPSSTGSPQTGNSTPGGGTSAYSNNDRSANLTVTDVNDVPTLTTMTTVVDGTNEEIEVEITFAELAAQGNEADVDGTVDAFVVKAVSTGTLKIGTSAIAATAWAAGSNDTINGTLNAYWTPATDDTGTINAFTVVAEDNDGDESTPAITAQVTVTATNDAPTISGGPFNLGSTDEDTISTGVQVATILGGFTTGDAEGDTLGLAITTASGNNVWQFSTDSTDGNDGNWTDFSAVNVTSALLLSNTSWVRYSPDTINPENVALTFRAWDGTSGTASSFGSPQNANPGAGGNPTAYSTANGVANLTVTDVNDVPTLTTMTTVVDGTNEEIEVEITFAELAAQGNEADVDGTVDAFVVKAVSTGTLKIGTSAIAATAWAAGSNDTINGTLNAYWTPATDDTGTINAFTVVAEDNDGDESTPAITAQVTVTATNDAPTISGGPFNLGSTDEDTISSGVQVATILGGFTTGDAEGDTLGLAITTASGNNVWQFSTDSTDGSDGNWTDFSAVNTTSALLLSNTSWVRYSPDTINPENVALTFRAWDGTSGTASSFGSPQNANPGAGGGITPYSNTNGIANLTVTDINDVPTLTTMTAVVDGTNEEIEVEITFADIATQGNEADSDGTVDAFVVKAISTGTLKIGASAIAATAWAAGSNDTINGTLNAYWTPATDDTGTINAFTVVAEDNDGDESTPAVTAQVTVTPVNDAPTISGGPFNLGSTDEDTISTGVQVSTMLGGFTTGDAEGDTLGLAITTATGNNVWQFSTDSTDGSDGNWTDFSAVNVTSALLLSNTSWVRYSPDTINPENVSLTFRAWDGTSGTASTTGTPQNANPGAGGGITPYSNTNGIANLTVTDINDVPTLTTLTTVVDSTAEETEVEITFADLATQGNEADSDGTVDAFVVKAISTGTLKIGTSAIAATAWAAGSNDTINGTLNAYWTPATDDTGTVNAFTVVAEDNDGDESTPAITAQVTVTPVNDAPTISGGPFNLGSTNEDTISTGVQVSTILGGFTTGDAEGDTLGLAITAATGNNVWQFSTDSTDGSDGNWTDFSAVNVTSALLVSNSSWVRYSPDTINPENVSLTFRAWDGTSGTASTFGSPQNQNPGAGGGITPYSNTNGIANLTVTDINDVPTLTTLTTVVDSTAEETEVEITFADLATQGNEADSDGTVDAFVVKAISTGTLKIGTSAIAATAWAAGSNDTVNGTLNAYWTPATDDTGTVNAFTVVAEDNDGDESTPAITAQVSVTASNDQPDLVGTPTNPTATEVGSSTGPVALLQGGSVTVTDPDAPTFNGGSITVALDGYRTGDVLSVAGAPVGISTVTGGSAADLTITLNAFATAANVATILEAIRFTHNGDDPIAKGADPTRIYDITLNDGGNSPGPALNSNTLTGTITLVDQNDVPTFTTLSGPVDTANALAEEEIRLTDIVPLSNAADVDGTVDGYVVKAIVSGTLRIGTSAGAATAFIAGVNDTINATNHAYWTSAPAASGLTDAFDLVAIDNDGAESVPLIRAQVNVLPSNQAPTVDQNTLTINEGQAKILNASDLAASDVDDPDPGLTISVSAVSNGQFERLSNPGIGITTFAQSEVTGGGIRFVHDGGENPPSYSITVSDGALSSTVSPATVFFTNLNDVPSIGLNKLTIDQGGSVTLTVGAELSSSDPDDGAQSLTYSVISVAGGQFERTDGSGVAKTFTQADVNAGLIRFVHDGGDDAPAYTLNVSDGTSNSKQSIAEIVFNPKEGNDFFDSEEEAASDEATEDALENIPDPTSDPDPEVQSDKPEPDPEETPPEEAPTTDGQQAIDDPISNTGPTLLATTTYDGEFLAITDQQTDYDRDGNRQGFLDKVRALLTDPLKSDAALVDPLLNQVDTALDLMVGIVQQSNFRNGLDSLRDDVADDAFIEKAKVGSTVAVSTGLSVGYVVWLIRGGVLLSSMLSALPAWRFIDPLPVLAFVGGEDEDDDESLESLVNNDAAANDAVQNPAELDPNTASKDGNA